MCRPGNIRSVYRCGPDRPILTTLWRYKTACGAIEHEGISNRPSDGHHMGFEGAIILKILDIGVNQYHALMPLIADKNVMDMGRLRLLKDIGRLRPLQMDLL